mmetsp:Transcript_19929/g.28035  ORF Transcript_19929/g.28035 Transcript_19929/m.28035 type:complete len:90 (+) Transcript_19929:275-544(+)
MCTTQSSLTEDNILTDEELLSIIPQQLYTHFPNQVYSTPEPGEAAKPKGVRSSWIEYNKKAISSFLTGYTGPWDVVTGRGNCTWSGIIN